MSLAQVLSTFLTLNLLIIIGWAFLRLYKFLETVTGAQLSSATELGLHYTIVAALLGLTVMHPLLPTNELLRPMTKVWSAQSLKSFSRDYSITDAGGYLAVPKFAGSTTVAANQISIILWILSCALVFAILRRIFIDLRGLQRIKKNSFLVRRIGRVSIYVNEKIAVPFSYWIPGQAVAVLPSTLVAKPADYQIAVRHELQHHRQADTTWVYVLWGLRVTAMINPIVHLWSRWISEIQEFACDETLVDQKKVESRQYARCLVEVAQSALNQRALRGIEWVKNPKFRSISADLG